MVEVTQKRLKLLYEYDPITGLFISKLYNKPVGFLHQNYLVVKLWHKEKERKFKLHQLAWFQVFAIHPSQQSGFHGQPYHRP